MAGPSPISSSSFSTVVPAELDEAPPAFIANQRKAENPSARELGVCKTVVATSVQTGVGLGTLALTKNPIAAIGATAASKLVGDAAAAVVCEGK